MLVRTLHFFFFFFFNDTATTEIYTLSLHDALPIYVDDGGVAEADVHRRGSGNAFECAVEGRKAVPAGLLRPRLHVGLVDLHDVGAGGEQIANFFVHRDRVIHRRLFLGPVVLVLRLLAHGEGTGYGHLDRLFRVGPQKLQILDLYRVLPPNLSDDTRHRVGVSRAVERRAGIVGVHAFERGGETIGVALAPDLAVGDDVQARFLLGADREQRRVFLRLREKRIGDTPQLFRAHARWKAPGELLAVDQPLRLRVTPYQRGRKQHAQDAASTTVTPVTILSCRRPKPFAAGRIPAARGGREGGTS